MADILYITVPCYNEEEVINETVKQLTTKMESLIKLAKIDENSKIIFIDDGSKDNTWNIIETFHKNNKMGKDGCQ